MQLWTTPLTTDSANTVLYQSRNGIQEITRKDFITWKEAKWASLVESMKNEEMKSLQRQSGLGIQTAAN